MYHLDIPKTRQYDSGRVEIIARNSVGESIATTELNVIARKDDYRNVLKNSPRRKYQRLLIQDTISCISALSEQCYKLF